MKIETNELSGRALDWAVAKCEGKLVDPWHGALLGWLDDHRYATDWAQGGPIVASERISITQFGGAWKASNLRQPAVLGETHLVAAMRCYVASKLGDVVDVPKELLK